MHNQFTDHCKIHFLPGMSCMGILRPVKTETACVTCGNYVYKMLLNSVFFILSCVFFPLGLCK